MNFQIKKKFISKRQYDLLLFILPAFLITFLFRYVPMYGLLIAFQNYKASLGIWASEWVGFQNFTRYLTMYNCKTVIINTVLLSASCIVWSFPAPILLALMLNEVRHYRLKRCLQTISYMPHFISMVVVVGMILIFLSPTTGIYGNLMHILGKEPLNLLALPKYFRTIYVISDVWQNTGWNSIIYLAALSSVDVNLYEAAMIEGISRPQKIWYIDMPYIMPTASILLVLSIGSLLNVSFEKVFLLQNSANISVSETIATYFYKVGIENAQYSFSTAVNLFNTLITFILLVVVNSVSRKMGNTTLW